MIRNIKAITAVTYLSMLFLGVASALIGSAAKNIGLSAYQIGLLITAQNIGFGAGIIITGALSDTHDKPRILVLGCLILFVSFLTFYSSPLFALNLLIMLCVGIGSGHFEGVSDALLLDLHGDRAGLHINVNHFFVTLGSIAIALYMMFLALNWRSATTQSAFSMLLIAVLFLLVRMRRGGQKTPSLRARVRLIATERTVAVLFIAMLMTTGAHFSTMGIISTFLTDVRGLEVGLAKFGLVAFLLGQATGRLTIGFFTPKDKMLRWILAMTALSAVLFSVLYVVDLGILNLVVVYLAGIAMSALLPLILAYAGLTYRQAPGTVMGSLKAAIPAGGIVMPFVLSMVTRAASLRVAVLLLPLCFVASLALLLLSGKMQTASAPAVA